MSDHIDPAAAPSWRALDGKRMKARENHGATETSVSGIVSVPLSLFAPALRCDGCESTARDEDGDGLDLLHLPGCPLAEELQEQRHADLAALAALQLHHLPVVVVRPTTAAEVDVLASLGLDGEGTTVVVQTTPDGGRRRWWPRLMDD